MSTSVLYQIIGYIGSALIVLSLTMKSLLKLRLIGLAGAVVFTAYGLLIEAYPVAGVNAVIVFVHLIFLRDLVSKKKEYFTILHVTKDSVYLQYFLDYHRDEIRHSVPASRTPPPTIRSRCSFSAISFPPVCSSGGSVNTIRWKSCSILSSRCTGTSRSESSFTRNGREYSPTHGANAPGAWAGRRITTII